MNYIKKTLVTILVITIAVAIAFIYEKQTIKNQMITAINNHDIVIDQTIHYWYIKDDLPLKIEIYIRNSGDQLIEGKLIFSGILSREGLEESFLKQMLTVYGSEELMKYINEDIDVDMVPRFKAIYNYIMRGNKLEKGSDFEPIKSADTEDNDDYIFKFRKDISISPGEVFKIDHIQQLPIAETGYLLSVSVNGIEF